MMEELIAELKSDGLTTIRELIDRAQQETLWLDFKSNMQGSGNPLFEHNGKTLSREAKRSIAKEISAFANSAGGILILGVDCRKDDDGVDCAQELTEIPNLFACLSTLNGALSGLVQPSISELEAFSISTGKGDQGVLIVRVPKSARRPHRSEVKGQREYFKRSGTNSISMEHYEIEDAFRTNLGPELELRIEYVRTGWDAGTYDMECRVLAKNIGNAAAKHVCVRYPAGNLFPINRRGHARKEAHVEQVSGVLLVSQPSDVVVLPGIERVIDSFSFRLGSNTRGRLSVLEFDDDTFDRGYMGQLHAEISCEGMRPTRLVFPLTLQDIFIAAGI